MSRDVGLLHQSSGDLLADRRFAWAAALSAEEDFTGAADLLDQVAALVPLWAPGWSALGDARDRLGDRVGAGVAWRRAATLDPEGRLGAGLKVARLGGMTPVAMPAAYVRALFDDYAPRFDRHLTEGLHYRGPELLAAALAKTAPGQIFDRALDLGCGTGLAARAMLGRIGRIDGIDLSPAMAVRARETGLYAMVSVASIEDTLIAIPEGTYDLVIAADVFVYVGDLAPVFRETHRILAPGGILAATLQSSTASPRPAAGFELGADLRFAHAPDYAEATLEEAGFNVVTLDAVSTRTEKSLAVPGLLLVARQYSQQTSSKAGQMNIVSA